MGYINRHLLPNESVEHVGSTSLMYLVPKLVGLLLCVGLCFIGPVGETLAPVLLIVAAFELLGLLYRCIVCLTSEFVITNKRVCLKRGLISIQVSDIALDKCDGVTFSQGFWGRILGFGTAEISSTGSKGQIYPALAHPNTFRNKLFQIIDKYK